MRSALLGVVKVRTQEVFLLLFLQKKKIFFDCKATPEDLDFIFGVGPSGVGKFPWVVARMESPLTQPLIRFAAQAPKGRGL